MVSKMTLLRFLSTVMLRHQKMSMLVVFFIIILLIVFQIQNRDVQSPNVFEDSVAYCNTPVQLSNVENRSFTNFDLMQVQVLIRHGDRAPIDLRALPNTSPVIISCLFNDTTNAYYDVELAKIKHFAEMDYFKLKGAKKQYDIVNERAECHGGQLTPYGYLQHIFLGELFRNTYRDLLKDINVETDVHVLSTDIARTVQSAASFTTGAFYQEFVEKSPKLSINVHMDRVQHGHLLLDENAKALECPTLNEENKRVHARKSVKFFLTNSETVVKKMASLLLAPRSAMPPYNRIVDVLFARLCHGQGVPLGPGYRLPNSLIKQALQFSHMYVKVYHSGRAELQTLSLLSQIAQHFLHFTRNTNSRKVVLYSGHDTMVAPLLQMLSIWDGKWPPYAASIFVEFYRKNGNTGNSVKDRVNSSYFRILYNGVAMKNIHFCKTVEGDGELCAVSDLFKFVSNSVYEDSLDTMDQSGFDKLLFSRIKKLCSKDNS